MNILILQRIKEKLDEIIRYYDQLMEMFVKNEKKKTLPHG